MTKNRLKSLMLRFRQNQRGVAAIEFAFIMPILILLLIGLCDIGDVLISDRMMVESAEAVLRAANVLIVPPQCTVTSYGTTPTQSCTTTNLSQGNISVLANIIAIASPVRNDSPINTVLYRVVNNNGTYAITDSFVVSGSQVNTPNVASMVNYLPPGGSALLVTIDYTQNLLFPAWQATIPLSTYYAL